jgi:hypothetical protein
LRLGLTQKPETKVSGFFLFPSELGNPAFPQFFLFGFGIGSACLSGIVVTTGN